MGYDDIQVDFSSRSWFEIRSSFQYLFILGGYFHERRSWIWKPGNHVKSGYPTGIIETNYLNSLKFCSLDPKISAREDHATFSSPDIKALRIDWDAKRGYWCWKESFLFSKVIAYLVSKPNLNNRHCKTNDQCTRLLLYPGCAPQVVLMRQQCLTLQS